MEIFLLKLVAFLRPLAAIEYAEALFAALGVGLFGLLVGALFMHSAVRKSLRMSAVDVVIVAFSAWCVAISAIYYEGTKIGEVAKLLVPLLSYTLVKNVVQDQREYKRLLSWIIVGFSVPAFLSAVLIVTKSATAVEMVNYWTDVPRWKGAYTGSHNLAHSMTLLLMTLVLYVTLRGTGEPEGRVVSTRLVNIFLVLLGAVALYCLYMSQVRTAVLGLLTFLGIFSYAINRKVFLIGAVTLALVAVATSTYWLMNFNPELAAESRGREVDTMELGSGRPRLWLNDITVFSGRPIDEQLAGAGIGNRAGDSAEGPVYGHNDWLEILTQTGLIGFLLFATLQVVIFKRVLRLQGKERYAFLSLFATVNLMMLVSNSYAWRILVSHLYYMILAFIEIPPGRAESVRTAMAGDVK